MLLDECYQTTASYLYMIVLKPNKQQIQTTPDRKAKGKINKSKKAALFKLHIE